MDYCQLQIASVFHCSEVFDSFCSNEKRHKRNASTKRFAFKKHKCFLQIISSIFGTKKNKVKKSTYISVQHYGFEAQIMLQWEKKKDDYG